MEMEIAKPQKEHEFLKRIVGDWVMTSSSGHEGYDADDPSQQFTETVRSVGGLWIIGNGTGKMPDGTDMTAVITVGFDPAKGNFVGTWVGSMMTNLWVYKGWLEEDGKTLTLEAEGPAFDGSGGTAFESGRASSTVNVAPAMTSPAWSTSATRSAPAGMRSRRTAPSPSKVPSSTRLSPTNA